MGEPQIDDELLNRYADGDLSASEAATVEDALSSDAGAKAQYDAILRLRTMIDASGHEMATGADADRMFAAIEAGIAADAAEEAKATAPRPAAAEEGWWARLMRSGAWMPAAGTVAAVAAVLLTIYSPVTPEELAPPPAPISDTRPGDTAAPGDPETVEAETEAAQAGEATPAAAPDVRSEIVEVDFGQNAGTVFEIALENGSSTPVVWINDDE